MKKFRPGEGVDRHLIEWRQTQLGRLWKGATATILTIQRAVDRLIDGKVRTATFVDLVTIPFTVFSRGARWSTSW